MNSNKNYFIVKFKALPINDGFARACVAAFCLQLNPSVDELMDIKTSVSEAVTNCIVHAYPNKPNGEITLSCEIEGYDLIIKVADNGVGIKDIEKARQPFFTSKPSQERSGMGFSIMEAFMDKLEVVQNENRGTTVTLTKHFEGARSEIV